MASHVYCSLFSVYRHASLITDIFIAAADGAISLFSFALSDMPITLALRAFSYAAA